jgi:hypothetical protein
MPIKIKIVTMRSLAAIRVLLLSACGVAQLPAISQPTVAPGYANGPGLMGGGGIMGSYGYGSSAPTAVPTTIGAVPVPVDEKIKSRSPTCGSPQRKSRLCPARPYAWW